MVKSVDHFWALDAIGNVADREDDTGEEGEERRQNDETRGVTLVRRDGEAFEIKGSAR